MGKLTKNESSILQQTNCGTS